MRTPRDRRPKPALPSPEDEDAIEAKYRLIHRLLKRYAARMEARAEARARAETPPPAGSALD